MSETYCECGGTFVSRVWVDPDGYHKIWICTKCHKAINNLSEITTGLFEVETLENLEEEVNK